MATCMESLIHKSKIGYWGELTFLPSNNFVVSVVNKQWTTIGHRQSYTTYNRLTIDTIFIPSLYTTGSQRNFKKVIVETLSTTQ